jgi:hypothetical protein
VWAKEDLPGRADHVLLSLAQTDQRVTVTCDTDFGGLAFHSGLPVSAVTCGVVLLRIPWTDPITDNAFAVTMLTSRDDWTGVVERDRIRLRPLPQPTPSRGT